MIANPYLSLEKALRILELLAERSPRRVTEITQELALEKSGVSRMLKTLAGWGYAAANGERGSYRLGARVLLLGERYLQSDRLVQEARPVLRDLALAARASAHLAVAVGRELLVVAKESSPERIQVETRVGGRAAPHASALGKVLVATASPKERAARLASPLPRFTDRTITDRRRLDRELADVRRRGYAFEIAEEHPGVGCIGAPVRDASGAWVAAVSVSGPLQGTPFRVDAAHARLAVEKAREISRRLGYAG